MMRRIKNAPCFVDSAQIERSPLRMAFPPSCWLVGPNERCSTVEDSRGAVFKRNVRVE